MITGKRPAAMEVAARLGCLYCEFIRGWADVKKTHRSQCRLQTDLTAAKLAELAAELPDVWGIADGLTKQERRLLKTKLGRLKRFEARRATWRAESSEVLAWSLGLRKQMPNLWTASSVFYSAPYRPERLSAAVPRFLREPVLRDWRKIDVAHRVARLWTWRGMMHALINNGWLNDAGEVAMRAAVARHLEREKSRLDIDLVDGDLAVRGRAYAKIDGMVEWHVGSFSAPERQHATTWLVGGGPWDEIPIAVQPKITVNRKYRERADADLGWLGGWSANDHSRYVA